MVARNDFKPFEKSDGQTISFVVKTKETNAAKQQPQASTAQAAGLTPEKGFGFMVSIDINDFFIDWLFQPIMMSWNQRHPKFNLAYLTMKPY